MAAMVADKHGTEVLQSLQQRMADPEPKLGTLIPVEPRASSLEFKAFERSCPLLSEGQIRCDRV